MDEDVKGRASDLAKTIKENTKPQTIDIKRGDVEKGALIVIPNGMKAEGIKKHLDEYKEKPDRRTGTIIINRAQSFIDIVQRFKSKNSVVFGNVSVTDQSISAGLTAIFDYHPEGDKNEAADNCDHRAIYGFPISKAFKNWLGKNDAVMSQIDFAYFLEKRISEMATPTDDDKKQIEGLKPTWADPIDILELSRGLELYSNESFVQRNKLSSGEQEVKFTSQHVDGDGKPVKIPDFFVINIPVFEGGPRQRILAHLRYRKKDSILVWSFELYNVDEMLLDAFENASAEIKEAVDLPLFFGKDAASN